MDNDEAPGPAPPPAPRLRPAVARRPRVPRTYTEPFPIRTECTIDVRSPGYKTEDRTFNGLKWTVLWLTQSHEGDIKKLLITIRFNGLDGRSFKVNLRTSMPRSVIDYKQVKDHVIVIGGDRDTIKLSDSTFFSVARENDGIITPENKFTLSVESIKLIQEYSYKNQVWPLSTQWIIYGKDFSVRMNPTVLRDFCPKFDIVNRDLKSGQMSLKEARVFFEFCGFLFHQWGHGSGSFKKSIRNGFKMGFTSDKWKTWDHPDSGLDFVGRTALPYYQHITTEVPKDHVPAEEEILSGCLTTFFELNDFNDPNKNYCTLKMNAAKETKAQITFYIEQTLDGPILCVGACIQPKRRQLMMITVTFFINREAICKSRCRRIIDEKQQTINMPIMMLDEKLINSIRTGIVATDCQLHVIESDATNYITKESPEEVSSEEGSPEEGSSNKDGPKKSSPEEDRAHLMPGFHNATIRCNDGAKILICKEFVSNYSDTLRIFLFNSNFADTGLDIVSVNESFEVVMAALEIIYHRSHTLKIDTWRRVLNLGDFWMCSAIKDYVELAVIRSDLLTPLEKKEIASSNNLQVLQYIIRHPEYATEFAVPLSEEDRRDIPPPMDDEIDGGEGGRPLPDDQGPNQH